MSEESTTVRLYTPTEKIPGGYGEDYDQLTFGVKLPNGTTVWSSHDLPFQGIPALDFARLNQEGEQGRAQELYRVFVTEGGIPYSAEHHRLRFVSRVRSVRWTKPAEIEDLA